MKTVELVALGPCGTFEQQEIAGLVATYERRALCPDRWFYPSEPLRFRRVVRIVSHMSKGKR
jgi:hypothetical protein